MKTEKTSPPVRRVSRDSDPTQGTPRSEQYAKAVRAALRGELRHHRPTAIDAAISRSEGYLHKFCRGDSTISIDRLLWALDAMGLDPGRFFGNALCTARTRDGALSEIAASGQILSGLLNIEKVAEDVVAQPLASASGPDRRRAVNAEKLLAQMLASGVVEQRRRLRSAQRYRQPAFARGYLDHLDALRYDRPREAARSAQVVALHLVPRISAPLSERFLLLLEAIGIYASAQRMVGEFATAARALHFALRVARDQGLPAATAKLLQRSSYVLSDHGRFTEAMEVLDEAVVIFFDLDLAVELGMVMVDRGNMRYYVGEYEHPIEALSKGLGLLEGESAEVCRNRVAAYQILAHCYQSLGDLEQAEEMLSSSVQHARNEGGINRAKILWQVGAIALDRGFPLHAEKHLRQAQRILSDQATTDRALVALDLTRALVETGKIAEAGEVALSMAAFLGSWRSNRVLVAALNKHLQNTLRGEIRMKDLEKVRRLFLKSGARPAPRS